MIRGIRRTLMVACFSFGASIGPASAQDAIVVFKKPPSNAQVLSLLGAHSEPKQTTRSIAAPTNSNVRAVQLRAIQDLKAGGIATVYSDQGNQIGAPQLPSTDSVISPDTTASSFNQQTPTLLKTRLENVGIAIDLVFDIASPRLKASHYPMLDPIGSALAQAPDLRIRISGHTAGAPSQDSDGSQHLAEMRAAAVRNYFQRKFNILPDRISVSGYGTQRPLPGLHPADARNRRVQFQRF